MASAGCPKSTQHIPQDSDPTVQNASGRVTEAISEVNSRKRKKTKRKKTTAQRGPTALPKNRGTGFEEFFADPPMTPAEAAEERIEIYAKSVPFEERIQSCIQRFRSRRRLQGDQVLFFNEYLFLGGIDTSANAFSGLCAADLKDLTPAERHQATATDTVHFGSAGDSRFYNGDDENWSVDFAGIAAGFFSTTFCQLTAFEPKRSECAISVVENFLRYVLHHEVCPEYKDNVKSALSICQLARKEWPMINQFNSKLPGCFNLAGTELFATVRPDDWSFMSFSKPQGYDARTSFLAAIALCDTTDTLRQFENGDIRAMREISCTLEVTRVVRPSETISEKFSALHIEGSSHSVELVGKAFFKPALIDDNWVVPKLPVPPKDVEIWVYFEDSLLEHLLPGMKLNMTMIELNTGLRLVRTITLVVPTFYTFLPQEMMKYYKEPKPSERPAPSVDDPESAQDQFAEEE